MKPTFDYGAPLLKNEAKFQDPFFQRFRLSKASAPFQLDEKISKSYLFPIFYADVTCAIGIFMCDHGKAQAILPHPKMKPVKIPIMADPIVNIPVLPMVLPFFRKFGYYVFGMPVTSKENQLRGERIWGLPKVTREVDIFEQGGDCVGIAREESGTPYVELRVPMRGSVTEFDVRTNLYSQLGGDFLRSEVCFKGSFKVTKHMKCLAGKGLKTDRLYLKIADTPSAQILRSLDSEEHPFQLRYARHISRPLAQPASGPGSPAG